MQSPCSTPQFPKQAISGSISHPPAGAGGQHRAVGTVEQICPPQPHVPTCYLCRASSTSTTSVFIAWVMKHCWSSPALPHHTSLLRAALVSWCRNQLLQSIPKPRSIPSPHSITKPPQHPQLHSITKPCSIAIPTSPLIFYPLWDGLGRFWRPPSPLHLCRAL